jgi:hypothetical protein
MRTVLASLLALSVALVSAPRAQAQAGRYIPLPRLPTRLPSGGGDHFFRYIPFHFGGHGGGHGDDTLVWVIVTIVGAIVLVFVGWHLGRVIGRWFRSPPKKPKASWPSGTFQWQATVPPMQDLILQPGEVAAKAEQTRRLLEFLAHHDRAFDPEGLRMWAANTFTIVQQAWEARDYSTVRDLLLSDILAKHEGLLQLMRDNREINRIEDLRIERLEFIHLQCSPWPEEQEVTMLITFRASVYFVHDRTGARTRGSRAPRWFQEFWTFRRQGEKWLLRTIEQSYESDRLERANYVAELSEQQLENAQQSITL